MFGQQRFDAANIRYLGEIEAWVRERFQLCAEMIVLVSEQQNSTPGFPKKETVVLFWLDTERRYRFRVFKPVSLVTLGDIPIRWLLPSLLDDSGENCC
ncbi:MAG: hypothetical protein COA47_12765 [Robiginitomaculum sp.]|nr:MAG: hypothetical protein COA47_12765 [Robiginitomaculum sp.]